MNDENIAPIEDFKRKHILNPLRYPDYERWDKRQQNEFLRDRLSIFQPRSKQAYGKKSLNSVIIATSQEILEDFRNPGVKFLGENKPDHYWSNQKYNIWLYKKSENPSPDGAYSVTELMLKYGSMHFLAKVVQHDQSNRPVHFGGQGLTPDPNNVPDAKTLINPS